MAAATASAWSMAFGTLSRRTRAPPCGKLVASPAAKMRGSEVRPAGRWRCRCRSRGRRRRRARLGLDADADEDEVGGEVSPSASTRAGDAAPSPVRRASAAPSRSVDAVAGVEVAEEVGGGGGRDAGEDARGGLEEGDLEALLARAPRRPRGRCSRRRRSARGGGRRAAAASASASARSRMRSTPARAPPRSAGRRRGGAPVVSASRSQGRGGRRRGRGRGRRGRWRRRGRR